MSVKTKRLKSNKQIIFAVSEWKSLLPVNCVVSYNHAHPPCQQRERERRGRRDWLCRRVYAL